MPYIKPLCDLIQKKIDAIGTGTKKESDSIFCLPPASSKSLIMSIFALPWAWINYPKIRFLGVSHNSTKANEFAAQSRRLIESIPYQKYFPLQLLDDQNTKGNFQNEHNGSRSATSIGANVLGSHYDWIVSDDLETTQDCKSESERTKVNEYATAFLPSRLGNQPHAQIFYVMQRLHIADLVSYLDSTGIKFDKVILPAEQTGNILPVEFNEYYQDGLLDNARLTHEYLEGKREIQGNAHFNAQYLQNPGDDEDAVLKESDFDIISWEEFEKIRTTEAFHTFVDGAYTASKKNDPTAALTACVINNRAYIVGLFEDWLEFPDLKKKLRTYLYDHGYSSRSGVYIEPKGPGLNLIADYKETDINARPGLNPTTDKADRLLAIQQRIQCRKVVLLRASWNRKFLNQVSGQAKHDDIKDALCMLVHQLVPQGKGGGKYSMSFADGTRIVTGEGKPVPPKATKYTNWGGLSIWQKYDQGKFE
jgi:predicted phage terminase large subunit-like protein